MGLDQVSEVRLKAYESPITQYLFPGNIFSEADPIVLSTRERASSPWYCLQRGWGGADAPPVRLTYSPVASGHGSALTSQKIDQRRLTIPVSTNIVSSTGAGPDRSTFDRWLFNTHPMLLGFRRANDQHRYMPAAVYGGGFDREWRKASGNPHFRLTFSAPWGYFVRPVVSFDFTNPKDFTIPDGPGPVVWGFNFFGNPSTESITIREPNIIPGGWTYDPTNRPFPSGRVPTSGAFGTPSFPFAQLSGFLGAGAASVPIGVGRTSGDPLPPYLTPGTTYSFETRPAGLVLWYWLNFPSI